MHPLYPVTLKLCPEPSSDSMERTTSRVSPVGKVIAVLLKKEEERRCFVVELFFICKKYKGFLVIVNHLVIGIEGVRQRDVVAEVHPCAVD